MAIICYDFNILFIMTPRTASTAIGKVLTEKMGGEYIPRKDILDSKGFFQVQKKHSTIPQLLENQLLTKKNVDSLFTFTCVRNPFDSLASLYTKKKFKYRLLMENKKSWIYRVPHYIEDMNYCKTLSFDDWIFKNYKRGIIKRLIGKKPSMYRNYTRFVNKIIHFENLDRDFQHITTNIAHLEDISLPNVNKTIGRVKDYRRYYSRRSKDIVNFVLHHDLSHFNYSF